MKYSSGFSLIEVMTTMAILGLILASMYKVFPVIVAGLEHQYTQSSDRKDVHKVSNALLTFGRAGPGVSGSESLLGDCRISHMDRPERSIDLQLSKGQLVRIEYSPEGNTLARSVLSHQVSSAHVKLLPDNACTQRYPVVLVEISWESEGQTFKASVRPIRNRI